MLKGWVDRATGELEHFFLAGEDDTGLTDETHVLVNVRSGILDNKVRWDAGEWLKSGDEAKAWKRRRAQSSLSLADRLAALEQRVAELESGK